MKWWLAQNVRMVMFLLLIPVLCVFLCLAVFNAGMGNYCAMIFLATALLARKQATQKVE
jgi:L-lactate permease